MDLEVGFSGSATYTVTDDMSPAHLPRKVLSTPSMIQLIEATCLQAIQPLLGENETTVGVHVCVSHEAAAASGQEVEVGFEIEEIDRRRLVFRTTVTSGDDTLSQGTHQRFVVDTSKMG